MDNYNITLQDLEDDKFYYMINKEDEGPQLPEYWLNKHINNISDIKHAKFKKIDPDYIYMVTNVAKNTGERMLGLFRDKHIASIRARVFTENWTNCTYSRVEISNTVFRAISEDRSNRVIVEKIKLL